MTPGAWLVEGGAAFRVWAPEARAVDVLLEGPVEGRRTLARDAEGYFAGQAPGIEAGQLYRYCVNGGPPFPDPASRFQPRGVHGPSQVVALERFPWTDGGWRGVAQRDLVIYELHVGTFSAEGTYEGVIHRLPVLRDLGVTAIELLPLADFPGRWNWGYDGVSIYAPARCYGTPEDLQRLVDAAHAAGLSVILDVVYNHLGPDGNYTGIYSPYYFTNAHHTPWGNALNFDGPHSRPVRDFFLNNALHWLRHYHFDGLRLDAIHAIIDDSPKHFLAELSERVHAEFPERNIVLIAEDDRNLNTIVRPREQGGWGLDGVWADDFHHEMRRLLAGDSEGYFRDYEGRTENLATILNQGWLFTGQSSTHKGGARGSDPAGLSPEQFVLCIQNHDQVGNRALGERLHHQIDAAAYRAASAVLLLAAQTPLLFMGQEWAATSPFCFFTDHNEELGKLVTAGRREEFSHFSAFSDPAVRDRIPDPQAEETFRKSKLKWEEMDGPGQREMWLLYQTLLALRKKEPALQARDNGEAHAWDDDTLVLGRHGKDGPALLLVARLRGSGVFQSHGHAGSGLFAGASSWQVVLHTEEGRFAADARPLAVRQRGGHVEIDFPRAGAVVFRAMRVN